MGTDELSIIINIISILKNKRIDNTQSNRRSWHLSQIPKVEIRIWEYYKDLTEIIKE